MSPDVVRIRDEAGGLLGGGDPVLLEIVDGSIAVVRLNRPLVRNAVNASLARTMDEIIRHVEDDEAVRVAIISGVGDRAFCAGADLKEVADGRLDATFTDAGGFAGFVNAPRQKPWIAAVNGFALAGGFEIVLACDLVVASENASFGLPEVKRGLIASAGGLYRLPRTVPRAVALELILTGGLLDAPKAAELGLVNRIVAPDLVLEEALKLARLICENAPLAIRESLAIARAAARTEDPKLRAWGDEAQRTLSATADYREGSRAFVEKRRPHWQNR